MNSGCDLLDIQPPELKFPLELKKKSSCSLQLTNKTDKPVALRVKMSNPTKYCVRPNIGMILPGKKFDVTVTMKALEEEPPQDMQCKDKFLVQSVSAREIFNKETNPPSLPVPEQGSSSTPSASCMENGSQQGTSLFDAPKMTSILNRSEEESFSFVGTAGECFAEKLNALKENLK
ncbi:hypothetical protein MKX01_027411, partial [Papaver californicum]